MWVKNEMISFGRSPFMEALLQPFIAICNIPLLAPTYEMLQQDIIDGYVVLHGLMLLGMRAISLLQSYGVKQ